MPIARSGRQLKLIAMPLLLYLMKLVIRFISRLVGIAVVGVCLPRVPPRNWNNNTVKSVACAHKGRKHLSDVFLRPIVGSITAMDDYLALRSFRGTLRSTDSIFFGNVPSPKGIPKVRTERPPNIVVQHPKEEEDSSMTAVNTPSSEVDFSIYSDVSSPDLNKAMYITPPRSNLVSAKEFQLNLLKAASERVSEILRENRRRLDAGEDLNAMRREARRRRAQELSAARTNRDSFPS